MMGLENTMNLNPYFHMKHPGHFPAFPSHSLSKLSYPEFSLSPAPPSQFFHLLTWAPYLCIPI